MSTDSVALLYHLTCLLYFLLHAVDYEVGPQNVEFEMANSDTQCVDISIIDDDLVEPMEDFTVEIAAVSPFVNLGSSISAVVGITDNDSKYFSW